MQQITVSDDELNAALLALDLVRFKTVNDPVLDDNLKALQASLLSRRPLRPAQMQMLGMTLDFAWRFLRGTVSVENVPAELVSELRSNIFSLNSLLQKGKPK